MIKESLTKLVDKKDLTEEEMSGCMEEIMNGTATPSQIASFLTALRMKGESVEEISSAMLVMRKFMIAVKPQTSEKLLDIVGTGGDKLKTFNVSTCSAIVASAVGCKIAKHGNRSFTSLCGSADVLEKLGVKIGLSSEKCAQLIDEIGFTFMFAPSHHPAMKFAGPVRKEIGFRTVFNILGPITNPAMAQTMLVGVFDEFLVEKIALVLKTVGVERALVVHGLDGLDEFSIIGKTVVVELIDGKILKKTFVPKEFGFKQGKIEDIAGKNPEENAQIILDILNGTEKGAKLDAVLLNCGAGIYVNGKADSIKEGIELAKQAIVLGKALKKLDEIKMASNE